MNFSQFCNIEAWMCISYTGKVLSLDEACPYTDKETMLRWAEFSRDVCKLCLSPEELALVLGICITFRGKLKHSSISDYERSDCKNTEFLFF